MGDAHGLSDSRGNGRARGRLGGTQRAQRRCFQALKLVLQIGSPCAAEKKVEKPRKET